jgi:hypothetical protein
MPLDRLKLVLSLLRQEHRLIKSKKNVLKIILPETNEVD